VPSKTPRQRKAMAAAAHDPKIARNLDIPQKVAREFNAADQKKAGKGKAKGSRKR
jgi:hypothetical protein